MVVTGRKAIDTLVENDGITRVLLDSFNEFGHPMMAKDAGIGGVMFSALRSILAAPCIIFHFPMGWRHI